MVPSSSSLQPKSHRRCGYRDVNVGSVFLNWCWPAIVVNSVAQTAARHHNRRIIKGRPFEVDFECEAKLYDDRGTDGIARTEKPSTLPN
jgi:hypothetical protein